MGNRIAFVFPGQGSQNAGMLSALSADWPVVEQTFAEASDTLGLDLWSMVHDDDGRLDQTEYTQPAMLAAGIAVHRVWQAAGGPEPECAAGHSLGEYTALVAAGVVAFDDALRLVAERARLMQNAVPRGEGGMAAILGLEDDTVTRICESVGAEHIVEPVNFNAPGQVVIAGHADAVARATQAARDAGARRAMDLPVSVPSHSSLMKEAADELAVSLTATSFSAPRFPVVHNVDASEHRDTQEIREVLRRQLYNPVRWSESVGVLRTRGIDRIVELGPGRVLCGLIRRIDRSLNALPVDDPATLEKAIDACR